jgi:micrococcal nuclease
MRKKIFIFILASLIFPVVSAKAAINKLSGKILLQVESKGEAWYVEPSSQSRLYLGRPDDAFRIMRSFGLGISDDDLKKITKQGEPAKSDSLARKLSGKILLQTQGKGEAWYINPVDLRRYYLGRPADAFLVMRKLGLGVKNSDLENIPLHKSQTSKKSVEPSSVLYRVLRVIDGDTVNVEMDGESATIRLIGLDTPESVHPTMAVECFGLEASERAKSLLTGQSVSLENDSSQDNIDKYGRYLRYLFLKDGTNFNMKMIADGYGYEYTYFLPYKYQKDFKAAQVEAKTQGKGLWGDGACGLPNIPVVKTETASSTLSCSFKCDANSYNCSDFKTREEAKAVFECCGGVQNDIHQLDSDKNGDPCESLP